MADILPKYNPGENAPNWTGASQKPDASAYRADKSMETLFSGIGDIVGQATATGYNAVTNKIKEQWNSVFDPVRDAQGVGDATQGANVGVTAPAADLSQQGKRIPAATTESFAEKAQRLAAAHADGRVSNTNYYSQLNAMTRQMKAQFPGFGEEVDAVVQKTTGVVPANALRNAMLEQLDKNKTEADRQAKEQEKERKELFQQYGSPAQMAKFQQTGQMPTLEEIRATAYPKMVRAKEVEAAKAELNLARVNREDTSERALQAATKEAKGLTESVFTESLEAGGGADSLLAKALKSGTPLSNEQATLVQGQFQAFKLNYEQRIRKVYEGYQEYINDAPKIDAAVKMHMGKIEAIERAIGAKDFTLAAMNARIFQGSRDEAVRKLYESSPAIRAMDTIGTMNSGKEVLTSILTSGTNGKLLTDAVKKTIEMFTLQSATGQRTEGKSNVRAGLEELSTRYGGLNKVPAAAAKELLDKHINLLSDDKVSPEAKANIAKDLFSDHNLVMTFTQRVHAFNRLASPAISAQMLKLKDKDPQAYGTYINWVKSNFTKIAQLEGNKIASAADDKHLQITFDPASNQFVPSLTPEGMKYASELRRTLTTIPNHPGAQGMNRDPNPLAFVLGNSASLREYATAIKDINSMIKTVEPVLKDGGYNPGQEMKGIFQQWGITRQRTAPKEPNFWQKLTGAIPDDGKEKTSPVNSFAGMPNFQRSSGDDLGSGRQTVSLTQETFNTRGVSIPDNGSKMTPENWSLSFYKPNDLMAASEGGAWVDSRAAQMAETLGKRFFEETGIRVGVNAEVPEGQTAGARRGTRDPNDLPQGSAGKASQHVHGKAFDFQIQNLSDSQKKRFLQMAHETGFAGIGFYHNGHLHLDARPGFATWGPKPSWASELTHPQKEPRTLKGYGLGS